MQPMGKWPDRWQRQCSELSRLPLMTLKGWRALWDCAGRTNCTITTLLIPAVYIGTATVQNDRLVNNTIISLTQRKYKPNADVIVAMLCTDAWCVAGLRRESMGLVTPKFFCADEAAQEAAAKFSKGQDGWGNGKRGIKDDAQFKGRGRLDWE